MEDFDEEGLGKKRVGDDADMEEEEEEVDTNRDSDDEKQEGGEEEDSDSEEEGSDSEDDNDEEEEEDVSMVITAEERNWALAIQQAVQEDPDGLKCNDFWCVHLALYYKTNVEGALDCIRHLDAFREEYGCVENYEYAATIIQEFVQMFPEFWMAFQYNAKEGHYLQMVDVAKFYGREIMKRPRDVQVWLSAFYYGGHSVCPDFRAIRHGHVILMENEGYDWKQNFDWKLWRVFMTEVTGMYPHKVHMTKNFNTGMFMNTLVSMAKPFMPKELYESFQMGCQSPMGGRLSEIYMRPTIQAANERLLDAYREALQKRYHNEASFSLQEAKIMVED